MLNQAALEALYSQTYVEDYLDSVENLPDDIQRNITMLRELDLKYRDILEEIEQYQTSLNVQKDADAPARKRILLHVQSALIRSQELGDEKLQILQQIQDLIENRTRQMDQDLKNLDFGREDKSHPETTKHESQPERASKRSRRQRTQDMFLDETTSLKQEKELLGNIGNSGNSGGGGGGGSSAKKQKKKKRKTKAEKERDNSPIDIPIDPDEPTYCLCEQVSFGEMIGCDNDECPIEWFHFSCVALTTKPKGKWYCPKCRGDRSNQMKPKT